MTRFFDSWGLEKKGKVLSGISMVQDGQEKQADGCRLSGVPIGGQHRCEQYCLVIMKQETRHTTCVS